MISMLSGQPLRAGFGGAHTPWNINWVALKRSRLSYERNGPNAQLYSLPDHYFWI